MKCVHMTDFLWKLTTSRGDASMRSRDLRSELRRYYTSAGPQNWKNGCNRVSVLTRYTSITFRDPELDYSLVGTKSANKFSIT